MSVESEFLPSNEARAYYDKYWAEAQTRQRSSSENFDKSILTYSSSGLAVSLAFLKDFVPIKSAVWPSLLYSSWLLFVLATSLTISSFLISYREQELSIEFAEKYFLAGKAEFRNKLTWRSVFLKYSNICSGGAFVFALIATAFFVMFNLNQGGYMTDKRKIVHDGMPSAVMQKTPIAPLNERGMPSASMPLAPSVPPKPATNVGAPVADRGKSTS
jgi:hypothetical protein